MTTEPDHPLVRAALQISTYASHDDDCTNHKDGSCSCGYTEANRLFLDRADEWLRKAGRSSAAAKPERAPTPAKPAA